MRRPNFDVEVRRSRGTVTVVPTGELDVATAGQLRQVLRSEDSAELIELDLSQLGFIDASGLSVVLEEYARSQQDGFRLHVNPGSGAARRLLGLVGAPWDGG